MASGDIYIERIEIVRSNSALNMNNPKESHEVFELATADDSEDDKDNISVLNKSLQDGTEKSRSKAERDKDRERKIGHRRVGVGGEITYKKIQTTQIMGSIQLGIQHAVGGLASKPERDLLMQDFMTVETTNFPSEGSNHTPAHHFSDFKYKNYAPIAFRYFRDLFGIQPDDFLMSMCDTPLTELSNPGASGSIFYLTSDDEFIIKTVQHKEGEFLQKLLPGYYMNLNQNPRTLLPKFFGLYCYQCNSKNVRLVIMNNLLPSNVNMHEKYDLKGSTYKRKASKAERQKRSPTYKDLDFMVHHKSGMLMEPDTYNALIKTIQRDCRVLESFKIMDYSLLLAIHNLDLAQREKLERKSQNSNHHQEATTAQESDVGGDCSTSQQFLHEEREREREDRIGAAALLNRSRSINRQRLVAHSTAMESIQAESEPIDEDDDTPRGGIPARNLKGERLLLFIGIIDILQSYRLRKKLEHTWKSMIHDGDTVSVHRPSFYAQRFQKFMAEKVFRKIASPLKHSPSKRKSLSKPLRHEELMENSVATPNSCCSTPPPTYSEGLEQRNDETGSIVGSISALGASSSSNRGSKQSTKPHHHKMGIKNYRDDSVSITDIKLVESRAETKSSLSVESYSGGSSIAGGGGGGAGHSAASSSGGGSSSRSGLTWTPPTSVEGSTPTWTEGTPSFTESSSSGDMGCPTTPLKPSGATGSSSSSTKHKKTVEHAINCLTTEMRRSLHSPRKMDRLRRSLRDSFRRKKNRVPESSKPHQWSADESAVRSGTCTFSVKYLGCVEVFNSRGMQVCEEALKVLRVGSGSRRRPIQAVLHVSGDGLRVVEEETKGLIVDQTIEKVSFCAPDRNHERGFSYICRDGTTRRWMCHGFLAIRESGERLSHAVGCAFAVCLERKQKRDRECGVTMLFDAKSSTFTRTGSFKQSTLTERSVDVPQTTNMAPSPPTNPFAIERPHATPSLLERQGSCRGFSTLGQNSPFKRQMSLRVNELPSNTARLNLYKSPTSPTNNGLKELQSVTPIPEVDPADSVTALCQQLSQGLSQLTHSGSDDFNFNNTASLNQNTVVNNVNMTTINNTFNNYNQSITSTPNSANTGAIITPATLNFSPSFNRNTAATKSFMIQANSTPLNNATTIRSQIFSIQNNASSNISSNLSTNNLPKPDQWLGQIVKSTSPIPPSRMDGASPRRRTSSFGSHSRAMSLDTAAENLKSKQPDPFNAEWVDDVAPRQNSANTNPFLNPTPIIPHPPSSFQIQL